MTEPKLKDLNLGENELRALGIFAAKVEQGETYFMVFDETYWSMAQLKGLSEAFNAMGINTIIAPVTFKPDGSAGVRFIDPESREEQ